MKLTLLSGGGFTGLTKEHSIDLNSLDEHTRSALMEYFKHSSNKKSFTNVHESWALDDAHEAPIEKGRMNNELLKLYNEMKENLSYKKK